MPEREPQSSITIRTASERDAKLLSHLAAIAFYEAYFEQDDPHNLADFLTDTYNVETIAAEIAAPESTFFMIFRDEKAVGYAKLRDGEPHACVTGNAIELQRLYLVERVWGTGLGEVILRHCIDFARELGKDSLWLGVWQENRRGQAFYPKHGFRKVGTLTFPYGDEVGINDVMQLDIK